MLSEQARAAIAAAEQRRTRWQRGEAPIVDPAFGRIGLDQVGVGHRIQAKGDGSVDQRLRWNGEARQGIVVATSIAWADVDDHSAEPAFTILDMSLLGSPRCRGTILRRHVDVGQLRPFDVGAVRAAVRSILREIVENGPSKGPIPELHKQLISDANRLIAVLDQKDVHR